MKDIWLTDAGQLVDFLEEYIKLYGNPTTQEQWADCLKKMHSQNKVQHIGSTDMSAGYIAGSLRDEGVNAQKLKMDN